MTRFFDFFSAEMDQTARLSIAPGLSPSGAEQPWSIFGFGMQLGNAAAQPVSGDGAKPAQLSQSTGFVQAAWAKMHKSLPDVRNESTLPAGRLLSFERWIFEEGLKVKALGSSGKCQVQSWMRDLQQLQEAKSSDDKVCSASGSSRQIGRIVAKKRQAATTDSTKADPQLPQQQQVRNGPLATMTVLCTEPAHPT